MAVRGDEMSPRSGSKTAALRRSQQIENGGGEYDEPRCGCRCFAARRVQCEVDTQGGERRSARALRDAMDRAMAVAVIRHRRLMHVGLHGGVRYRHVIGVVMQDRKSTRLNSSH